MKRIIIIIACVVCLQGLASATQMPPKELGELVKEADHVIGGRIIKVDMVDEKGNLILDETARTGPGLSNTIRLYLKVDKALILKTTKKETPDIIVVNLCQKWHFTLGQIKANELEKGRILLLKDDDYKEVYPMASLRDISEKKEILRLLKEPAPSCEAAEERPGIN